MEIITTIEAMRQFSRTATKNGLTVGVVPTMGFLHAGHLSLIDLARNHADVVIVTVFVNPTQFGPGEDYQAYPRDFERDCRLCREHGAAVVFAPEPEEMYPPDRSIWVVEEKLSQGLCGKTRPIHFRGVATVVAKLFNVTLPAVAVFGQKDAQQALIIRRMVRDLNFPVKVLVAPIVREADGLALSSRNAYLSAGERTRALAISGALFEVAAAVKSGAPFAPAQAAAFVREKITAAGGVIDYVEALNAETLEPAVPGDAVLLAAAARFGKARLLDNIILNPSNWRA